MGLLVEKSTKDLKMKVFIALLCLISSAYAWNYALQGADWGTLSGSSGELLYPECNGDRQSPIDIVREKTILYEGDDMLDFSFNYCDEISGYFKNNGHTILGNFISIGDHQLLMGLNIWLMEYEMLLKFILYMFVKITSMTFLEPWQIPRVWLFWEFSLKEELMMMLILLGLILLLMLLWKLLLKETTNILSVMKPGST